MFEKLKSRKLWATVAASAFAAFGGSMGIPEAVVAKVTMLVMAYVGGQSVVDAATAVAKK